MGLQPSTAIGKKLSISLEDKQGTIIGVVKDFNFKPVQQPVEPLVIKNNFAGGHVVLRTTPKNMHTIVADIKNVFGKIYGDYPFSYGFVDEDLSKLYRAEQRMGKLSIHQGGNSKPRKKSADRVSTISSSQGCKAISHNSNKYMLLVQTLVHLLS